MLVGRLVGWLGVYMFRYSARIGDVGEKVFFSRINVNVNANDGDEGYEGACRLLWAVGVCLGMSRYEPYTK